MMEGPTWNIFVAACRTYRVELLVLQDLVIGWSGYGWELIDLASGTITRMSSWSFDQYATSAAKVSEQSFLLVKMGRPVVYTPGRSGVRDLTNLVGKMESISDLGDGRVWAISGTQEGHFWNVRESIDWIERQDWAEFGHQPRDVLAARRLPGGHLAIKVRPNGDDARDFEFWSLQDQTATLAGSAKGPLPTHDPTGRVRRESYFATLGPLLVTWGGPPPKVEIAAAPDETLISHLLDDCGPLRWCVPLIGADGSQQFAVSALACADEAAVRILCLESGATWSIPIPFEGPVTWMSIMSGDLVIASKSEVWRVDFPSRLPRDPCYVLLVDATRFAAPGLEVEFSYSAHLAKSRLGLALFRVRSKATDDKGPADSASERSIIVAAYDLDKGIVAHEQLSNAESIETDAEGFVLWFPDGLRMRVWFDTDTGRIERRVMAPNEPVDLRLRSGTQSIRGADDFRHDVQALATPREDKLFCTRFGRSRIIFEHNRIRVTEEGGVREESWFAPDGYSLFDFDPDYGRAYVAANRGFLQVLDFGPPRSATTPVSLNALLTATPDSALLQLVRYCGRPDLSANAALYWLSHNHLKGDGRLMPHWLAQLYIELAESALALGDLGMAAKAGAEAQNIMLTGVGETSEKEMLLLRYGLLMISIKLGIFCGDFEGIRARLFPSQEQGKLSEHQFRVSGVLWIDSALAVFRKDDPKRAHLLVKCRGEMERAFADLGPGVEDEVLRTGLEDLDLLLTFAESSSLADMSTLDWAAELGPQHADLLVLANGGDAAAMSDIGAKFGAGDGVKRNALYASYWYERASNGGNAVAALNLAQMYRHGEGVQMDLERGVALTRLAAERGLTMAKCNLGVMLMLGQGCTANPHEAREWLRQAAEEGDQMAPISLAILYATGQGGTCDLAKAREYLVPLIEQGNTRAIQVLASIDQNDLSCDGDASFA